MAQQRLDAIAAAPQVRALLASATCWMCCCLLGFSSHSGVLGAAGWTCDKQRNGYVRDMTSRGFAARRRWTRLVDAHLRAHR